MSILIGKDTWQRALIANHCIVRWQMGYTQGLASISMLHLKCPCNMQAAVLADAAGVEVNLPDQVRRTAAKWWSATRNMVPSLSHTSVSKQLRQRGVPHSMMVHIREGLPTIDIAIQPKTGSRSAALQVLASRLKCADPC